METPPVQGELEGILSEAGVDPSISVHILGTGWNKHSFAVCALSLADLENHWGDLLGDTTELSLQQKACIRLAWQMCQHTTPPTQATTSALPPQAPSSASGSWSETFTKDFIVDNRIAQSSVLERLSIRSYHR